MRVDVNRKNFFPLFPPPSSCQLKPLKNQQTLEKFGGGSRSFSREIKISFTLCWIHWRCVKFSIFSPVQVESFRQQREWQTFTFGADKIQVSARLRWLEMQKMREMLLFSILEHDWGGAREQSFNCYSHITVMSWQQFEYLNILWANICLISSLNLEAWDFSCLGTFRCESSS